MVRRRTGNLPSVNVFTDGPACAANLVSQRLAKRAKSLDVTIDERGYVRADEPRHDRKPRPDSWRVGRYFPGAEMRDIRDDIEERMKELQP